MAYGSRPGGNPGQLSLEGSVTTNVPGVVVGTLRGPGTAGRILKQEGMAWADEAACEVWRAQVDEKIEAFAQARIEFTAEDIRSTVGDPPAHPNALGARFNAAARRGLIRKVGFEEATRASAHRRILTVWRGTGE